MALPAVDDVLISRGLPDTVRLELIERGAGIRWQSGDTISVLDSSGVVFVQRPVTPPEQLAESTPLDALPLVVDTSALPVTLGQQVVGRLVIQFIRTAEEERARLLPDYPLDHFAVTTSTNQVTLVTKNGLEVLLATIHDPGVQMRNLARMAAADALTRATVVDLRVDRWAYVR
jgi:cell division septal protein FtsQ